ncbi:MAG: hypothetical protein R3B47_00500 [Bacteroidia bacterium]
MAFISGLFLTACGESSLAELRPEGSCWAIQQKTRNKGWSMPEGLLELPVQLCLTNDFPFSNLYIQARLSGERGLDTSWIAEPCLWTRLEKWETASNQGQYTIMHPVLSELTFPKEPCRLSLGQYMRSRAGLGVVSVAEFIQRIVTLF